MKLYCQFTADDSLIAGIVNERLFVLDLNTLKMQYILLKFPKLSHIAFSQALSSDANNANNESNRTNIVFFAQSNVFGEATNARQPNGLYQYNINTQQISLLKENVKAQVLLALVDETSQGATRNQGLFTLYDNDVASVDFQSNKPAIKVNMLDCISCWRIKGNYLYQLQPNKNMKASAQIVQISLLTGQQRKQSLLFNDVENHFSLHPSSHQMVLTSRQRLQTQLTKIEGLSQIY